MLLDILIPFIAVALAEFGDKTQLAVLTLATKYREQKEHTSLFCGAMLGFLLVDGIAILFGGVLTAYIPTVYIKIIAGSLFVLFGILTFCSKDGEILKIKNGSAFHAAFVLILLAELGDKTQIAAGLFATQYNLLLVFVGVMAALAVLTGSAIVVGKKLKEYVHEKYLKWGSGILFFVIGIGTLLSLFF